MVTGSMGRAKWVARGVYGTTLLLALGLAWWALHEDAPVPVVVAAPQVARPPPPPPPPPARGDDGAPVDAPPPLPVEPPSRAVPPVLIASPAPTGPRLPNHPVDQEALARESELIDRARAEVTLDPLTALKTLAEHHQNFPQGLLAKEEELTRVEALLRLGRRQEAERLAHKLKAFDGSLQKTLDRLLIDVRPN